jgi:hypothetical protein
MPIAKFRETILANDIIKLFLRLHLHLWVKEHNQNKGRQRRDGLHDHVRFLAQPKKVERGLALSAPAAYATPAQFLIVSISSPTFSFDSRSFRRLETNEGDAVPFF